MKYESHTFYGSKVMINVGQRSQGQKIGIEGNVLLQGIHMRNMKALPLTVQKLINAGQRSQSRSQGQTNWY